jgi:hypothetical protein
MRSASLRSFSVSACLSLCLLAARTYADSVQLANGDVLNGRVVGLDEQQLRLESEVHGKLSIPRAKIVSIHFGDRKPAPTAPAARAPAATGANLDDIFKQLRAGATNEVSDVQKLIPLLSNPDAFGFFQEKLRGLRDGSLSVQDIRKDAIRAREMVKDVTKGLGPEADQALAPYLGILERFIRETEPAKTTPPVKK